jgi:hypothetical protein
MAGAGGCAAATGGGTAAVAGAAGGGVECDQGSFDRTELHPMPRSAIAAATATNGAFALATNPGLFMVFN